ncbi:MAG: molybdenum cofactor biosynthesis protein MoaE [Planctomycetes bacterium]|nr:molybdenum cofactor biosynthesis protein MoaE [Planctomycetota bacterium]MBI3845347.1 molybdenum cofactor biosynthesis protein MoaE [Planctomycetota bacterium]
MSAKTILEIVDAPIDAAAWTAKLADPAAGAIASFLGVVRDHARGKSVVAIRYEAYREMALTEMKKIADEAAKSWPLLGLAIIHRVGALEIGEASVLVIVTSAHRADAFEACRFAIDTLKTTVPIWKHERYADGSAWVDN